MLGYSKVKVNVVPYLLRAYLCYFYANFRNFYVRADKVFHLRHLLDKSSSVQGLMSEEKGRQLAVYVLNHTVEILQCPKCVEFKIPSTRLGIF